MREEDNCVFHEFACEYCNHEFDPNDVQFECHEKRSPYAVLSVVNIILVSFMSFGLVDGNFGLFLLPYFSSDLQVLNYSVYEYLEHCLRGRVSNEVMQKIRRAKIKSIQEPTIETISTWQSSITLGALTIYGTYKGLLNGYFMGFFFNLLSLIISNSVKFLLGQWLGIVVFPGISRGFTKLSILYIYFKYDQDVAFKALYGLQYTIFHRILKGFTNYIFKFYTWCEIFGAVLGYVIYPSGIFITGAVYKMKKGHYCCVCDKVRKQRCIHCGYILRE